MMIRLCLHCEGPIGQDKRPHAVYCSRKCKVAASEQRRSDAALQTQRWEEWEENHFGPRPLPPQEEARRPRQQREPRESGPPRPPGTPAGRRDSAFYKNRYVKQREWRVVRAKENYWLDPETSRAYSRAWRKANPEKRRVQHANRRARKYNNPGYIAITVKDWRDALRIAGHTCIYCGVTGVKLVMDHIIPLARGGRHAPANIAPACQSCNNSKQDRLVSEWRHGRLPPLRR
jgi:5-methylcytosine-specific restriction endonuclease McrA